MSEPAQANDDRGQWHWVMTVSWPISDGAATFTVEGLAEAGLKTTRQGMYQSILEEVKQSLGVPAHLESQVSVQFFSLEPNDLSVYRILEKP